MFELPDLVSELICEYLSYYDLLNLRSTCKRLKQYMDQKEFNKLHLFVRKNHQFYNLFYENELTHYRHSFRIDYLQVLRSSHFKILFNQIQKLSIFNYFDYFLRIRELTINLNDLNYFSKLEHLEIEKMHKIEGKLTLKNLKILAVAAGEESCFEIKCPNLTALKLDLKTKPKLISGQNNLTYLYIFSECHCQDYLLNLYSGVQNLSKICFECCTSLDYFLNAINQNKLNLCFLEQIEVKNFRSPIQSCNIIETLSIFASNPSRKNIKFLINDLPIRLKELKIILNPNDSFHYFTYIDETQLKILNENSTLYDCIFPQISRLDLSEMVKFDENSMRKIKNLESIKIGTDKSILQFIYKTFPRLEKLYFKSSYDFTHELDELAIRLPYIRFLSFACNIKIDNFYFIGKFKNLRTLCMYHNPLEREVLNFIFNNCQDLYEIYFQIHFQSEFRESSILNDNFNKTFSINFTAFLDAHTRRKEFHEFDTLNALIDCYYEKNLFD